MAANRQVSIFINGKEVANQIKSITAEKAKLNRELNLMTRGTKEYEDAARELRKVNGIIAEHSAKIGGVQSSWKAITSGATKFLGVAGIAFGAEAVIQYGRELFKTGVNMDTLGRKAQTVLGDSLGYVKAEAEKAAAAMGLTNAEYVAAVTNIADLLKPMGFTTEEAAKQSVQIQNLSGALSEWSGGKFNAVETSESLRKALLGEREELERYGVSIKQSEVSARLAEQGFSKLTGQALKQAEAMATLQLITEKSSDAIKGYETNSDSAARSQAELTARIADISEKLATAMLPAFEALTSIAAEFVGTIADVAEFMAGIADPAKSLTEEFNSQALKVQALEQELPGLLDRYDELKGKTTLTTDEQVELGKIIQRIGELTPTAITEIDKYGNVLGISAGASRDFLEAEKARLAFVNKDAVKATEKQIEALEKQIAANQQIIKQGKELKSSGGGGAGILGGGISSVTEEKLTGERVEQLRSQVQKLSKELEGATAQKKLLLGEPIANQPAVAGGTNLEEEAKAQAAADAREKAEKKAAKDRQREAERELKDQQNKSEKLLEAIAKFKEDERLLNLSANDRRLAEVAAKYQDEINKAIELEQSKNDAVAAAATEQKIELLKLQSEALEEERAKIAEEELTALIERLTAENEALLELEQTQREARDEILKEIKEFTDEALLTEQELELQRLQEQGDKLLALAASQGEDTALLKEAIEARKAAIDKKAKEDEKKREEEALKASAAIQDAKLGLLKDLSSGLSELAGQSEAFQKAIFLFQKGVAAAEVIINLQRELAIISATYAAAPPVAITLSTIARVRAGISLATIAATGIAGIAKQKKHGGWANITGADDGQQYNALLIGQRPTGMLDYPHPVLMGSGILANEVGKEYYVSHHDLRKPAVLDHVRAIENITSHRQRANGGFASADPTQNVAGAGATTDPALMQLLQMNAQFLSMLLAKGVQANIGNDEILALKRQIAQLDKASGGRL